VVTAEGLGKLKMHKRHVRNAQGPLGFGMAIAFYDLDKTLLDVNSARLWIKRQVREKRIKKIDAMRAAWSYRCKNTKRPATFVFC